MDYLEAWFDLFDMAKHEPTILMLRGIPVKVNYGQIAISEDSLAQRWGWSRGKVRRFLAELRRYNRIVQQNSRLISILTIVYDFEYFSKIGKTVQQTVQQNGQEDKEVKPQNRKQTVQQKSTGNGLFQKFWQAYPRKVGHGKAEESWNRIVPKPDESFLNLVLAALAWQVTSKDWTKQDGQFIPLPATYLNQQRWLDQSKNVETLEDAQKELRYLFGDDYGKDN